MNENERIYWVDPEAIINHSIGKEKLNFDIDSSTWKYDEDTKTLKEAEGPAVISLGKESESNIILGADENLQILKNAGEGSKIILSASQVLVNGRDLAESFAFKTINNNLITGTGNFNLITKLNVGGEEFIPDAVGVINIENGFPDENAIHAIKVNDETLDKNEQKEVNLYIGQISDKTLVDGEYVETVKKIFDTEEVPDIKFKTINNTSLFATESETDIPIVGWNKSTATSGKTDLSVIEANSVTLGNPVHGQHLDSINLNAEKIYQKGSEISFNPVYINCDAQTVDGFLIPKIDLMIFNAIAANYEQASQTCILRRYTDDHFFFFNVLGCNLHEDPAPRIYIQSVNENSDSIAIIEYSSTAEGITTNIVKASSDGNSVVIKGEGSESIVAANDTCHAYGYRSVALGNSTTTNGEGSFAVGINTVAQGKGSFASGQGNQTSAPNSFVCGESCTISENSPWSHAEGMNTEITNAYAAHAEGYHTIAQHDYEHAEGGWNASHVGMNNNWTRHSIGIGTLDGGRKNAVEVMKNGDVYIYGIGGYNGTAVKTSATSTVKTIQDYVADVELRKIDDAPADGNIYGRQDHSWTKIDISSEEDPFIKTSDFEEKVGTAVINNQGLEATNPDNIIAAINQLYALLAEVISNS